MTIQEDEDAEADKEEEDDGPLDCVSGDRSAVSWRAAKFLLCGMAAWKAVCQDLSWCFPTRICSTWLTASTLRPSICRNLSMGRRAVLRPASVARRCVSPFSLLWSTSPPITYTLSPSSGPSAMSSSASLLKYTTVSAAQSSEKCCDSKRTFFHPAASCSSTSLGYTVPV